MVIDTCHKPIQLRFCDLRARTYFHVSSGPLSFGGCGWLWCCGLYEAKSIKIPVDGSEIQHDSAQLWGLRMSTGFTILSPHSFQNGWSWQCSTNWRTATTTRPLFVLHTIPLSHHRQDLWTITKDTCGSQAHWTWTWWKSQTKPMLDSYQYQGWEVGRTEGREVENAITHSFHHLLRDEWYYVVSQLLSLLMSSCFPKFIEMRCYENMCTRVAYTVHRKSHRHTYSRIL